MYRMILGFIILSSLVDLLALCDHNRSVGILKIESGDSDTWKFWDSDNWKSGDSDNWKSGDSDNWNYLFKEKEIIPALWMMFLSSLSPKTLYCS